MEEQIKSLEKRIDITESVGYTSVTTVQMLVFKNQIEIMKAVILILNKLKQL